MKNNPLRIVPKVSSLVVAAAVAFASLIADAADIGFTVPFEDWRTPMQIAGKHVKETFYEPVSVFTTNDELEISFGWTGKGLPVGMTPIRFSVLDEHGAEVIAWTEPASSATMQSGYASGIFWCGHLSCDILKLFTPGDYMLVAELDPANTLNEDVAARADNTTIFRFAIRDEALSLADMMSGFNPANVSAINGNDFAQAPHAALRDYFDGLTSVPNTPMVQFGPYVPMDGKAVSSRKKPLDLVFLVDISGSMGGCIRGLLNNIGIFIEKLMKGDADNDPIDDLRVKIVGFRDYKASWDRNTLGWYDEGSFSGNLSVLKAKLNSFSANGGGGNGGETSFDALWYVAKDMSPNRFTNPTACVPTSSPFRPKGEAARAVILFTDEAPHDPLSANGCAGLRIPDVVKAVEDAEITLTVITESLSWYSGNYGVIRFSQLADTNAYTTAAKNSTYIRTSNLATFANDASALRNLAGQVLSQVDTIVVEPSLVIKSADRGTLSFDWKNDSTADTNNVFRFACYNASNRTAPVTNIVCTATDSWEHVEMVIEEGDHTVEWNYRKTGYEGSIVDAGLIAGLSWEPWAVQLKVKPDSLLFECEGGESETIAVTCNTNWIATTEATWLHAARTGDGNGLFTVFADPNPDHAERIAKVTVTAAPGKDDSVTRTIAVRQKASPYVPNGEVQILTPEVKPRWPWNSLVDIDFRVVVPEEGVPVAIAVTGWDAQGEGFPFCNDYTNNVVTRRRPEYSAVNLEESRGVEISSVINDQDVAEASFLCKSSGVYRITWNLNNWTDKHSAIDCPMFSKEYSFHTPDFRVILEGTAVVSGVEKSATVTSASVRVDTRVGYEKEEASYAYRDSGIIITQTEKIGHPDGRLDPFPWDSTPERDGRIDLRKAYPEAYCTDVMTNLCLVLNDVQIEGGTITNNTTWMAGMVHVVRDNVYVLANATLTIEDGAVVKFCDETRIFAHYDPSSENTWNIISKGSYITGLRDRSYGGDTIYDPDSMDPEWEKGSLGQCFYDQDYPGDCDLNRNNGILTVPLKVVDSIVTNDDSTLKYNYKTLMLRAYSRNQQLGNLPRPVAPNEEFYGWFYSSNGDPMAYIDDYGYEWLVLDDESMVSAEDVPMDSDGYAPSLLKDPVHDGIYAISDKPDPAKYPTNYWPKADGGVAKITLQESRFTYNGQPKTPVVTEVKVDEVVVPPENYEVHYTDETDVGVYYVTVSFLHDYTNTPSASYAIIPAAAENATISFADKTGKAIESYMYSGSKFPEPNVKVSMDGRSIDESEFTYDWSDGDWTSVGKYKATVELSGNYTGTASAYFEIKENPNLEVVFYEDPAKADDRQAEMEKQGLEPRILYLSGSDAAGNAGIATRGIKKLLKEDVAIRSFVLTNFVCRYADWGSVDGSNKCTTVYAPGFGGAPLPFMGGISTTTPDKCIVWTNGYMSASELLSFLVLAATMPEALLPVLDAGATDEQVRDQIKKVSWTDPDVAASITNIAAYVKFRNWVESLDDATKSRLEGSARTYISSVVSDILASPRLFGDAEPLSLSISDFKASTSSPGKYEVTIELRVGDSLSALELNDAKEAFAGKVRLGTDPKNLRPAVVGDIHGAVTKGSNNDKVVLTVKMPSGNSGFITMKIE